MVLTMVEVEGDLFSYSPVEMVPLMVINATSMVIQIASTR